jgi:polyisoprenoid-binding protein YceI
MRNALSSSLLSLLVLSMPAVATDYAQAPGSTLAFGGTYQGEAFSGTFPGFSSTLSFDPAQLAAARLDVSIPLASATTGNDDYDGELRGEAFFDSSRFPQARYVATTFRALGGNRYAADGTLTLHGASRPVTLTFEWAPGPAPELRGKATVRRLDFGIGGGDWADTELIPDAIAISTRVVFTPVR